MQNNDITTSRKNKDYSETAQVRNPIYFFWEYLKLILGSGTIIFLDQWTKALVLDHIPFLGSWLPSSLGDLEPYFRIVHWRNSGAAFGLFQNGNIVFMVLAIIASLFIFAYYPLIDQTEKFIKVGMIFQLGGAVGNLIDRIRFGYVIDFISVGDFPVFNIADAAISTGVAVLIFGIALQEYKEYRDKNRADETLMPTKTEHGLVREKE